jgi:hypothetical protein
VESISVGSVAVYTPHLTDPIAPFAGFAMQAEVVRSTSKYSEFRKRDERPVSTREARLKSPKEGCSSHRGGELEPLRYVKSELFGQRFIECWLRRQLDVSNDERPPQQPPVDYLKVDIPDISIALSDAESSP